MQQVDEVLASAEEVNVSYPTYQGIMPRAR
jgi:hypothetical protein